MDAADDLLERLARSRFRARFRLGPKERTYLAARGIEQVCEHAVTMLRERVAPAAPHNDGRQTPMRGHPVFIAQHATASCCRSCLEKWHGIPKGRPLSDAELAAVVAVIRRWLERQDVGKTDEATLFD